MPAAGPITLRLASCPAGSRAAALGLRTGDLLVAVDGRAPVGPVRHAATVLSLTRGPRNLTMMRGGVAFVVTAAPRGLGPWHDAGTLAAVPDAPGPGWHIVAGPDGLVEAIGPAGPAVALLLPPLWLAGMRVWTGFAALLAALALALPFGPLALAGVWLMAGAQLWRGGQQVAVAARLAGGGRRLAVVSAGSEAAAQEAWRKLVPEARFRFAAPPRAASAIADAA